MQRLGEWIDKHWTLTRLSLLLVLALVIVGLSQGVDVLAAPAAKQQENGTCVKFATVGSFDQYHCVNPAGNEYDTNTAGFMVFPGN